MTYVTSYYSTTLLNEPFQMVNVFDQLTVNTEIIKKLVKILIFFAALRIVYMRQIMQIALSAR